MRKDKTAAWALVGLGLFLLALNQFSASAALSAVWIIGGSCLVAGLIGLVVRD